MPSPFPGMDPYLEDPGLWPDVHHELFSAMREQLNAALRPRYHVRIEERVYISDEDDTGREVIIPDLKVRQRPGSARRKGTASAVQAAVDEPIIAITLIDDEIREPFLKIIDLEIDYRRPPKPKLSPAAAAWAESLLKEKGLRD